MCRYDDAPGDRGVYMPLAGEVERGADVPAEVGPSSTTQTVTTDTVTATQSGPPSWLHRNVRNLLLLAVTGVVCWLAIQRVTEAVSAVVVVFASLASYLFAERAALAKPGETK